MTKTRTPKGYTRNHTKRAGKHHKQSRSYIKTYAPYLPLFVSIIASLFLGLWQPNSGNTLAYTTNTSIGNLLTSSNSERTSHSVATLSNNSLLNSAAQAKANDMVSRNYWSHNTPDGKEPWTFISSAGYSYYKAGENLAYGFTTSAETVAGWMNSPSHRANLLDPAFTQVGFGFANSSNFNGDGEQTVIVAMYASPQTAAAGATLPQNTIKTPAPVAVKTTPKAVATSAPEINKNQVEPVISEKIKPKDIPINTDKNYASLAAPVSQPISRIATLTGGHMPWMIATVFLSMGVTTIAILARHSLKLRHLIHDLKHGTEHFVLHHPLLDSTLIGLLILGFVLSRTAGIIL